MRTRSVQTQIETVTVNGVTTVTKTVTETIVEDGVETVNVYIYVNDKLGEYWT